MARHAEKAADLLKALAHPARLLVLCRLVEGEAAVGEFQPLVSLSQSALSQYLATLREMELVTTPRESQAIYYSLAEGPVDVALARDRLVATTREVRVVAIVACQRKFTNRRGCSI